MNAPFATYRDAETRLAMVEYVSLKHGWTVQRTEQELLAMNHVALAYLFIDMREAEMRGADGA